MPDIPDAVAPMLVMLRNVLEAMPHGLGRAEAILAAAAVIVPEHGRWTLRLSNEASIHDPATVRMICSALRRHGWECDVEVVG